MTIRGTILVLMLATMPLAAQERPSDSTRHGASTRRLVVGGLAGAGLSAAFLAGITRGCYETCPQALSIMIVEPVLVASGVYAANGGGSWGSAVTLSFGSIAIAGLFAAVLHSHAGEGTIYFTAPLALTAQIAASIAGVRPTAPQQVPR